MPLDESSETGQIFLPPALPELMNNVLTQLTCHLRKSDMGGYEEDGSGSASNSIGRLTWK